MVNYSGTLRDVSTVAHELGHGVHQFMAAERGYYNSSTTLVLAETASVFAELLLFRSQLDSLDDEQQKRAFTCQKLESIFATVFRQISMNRFEEQIHNRRREKGEMSSTDLADLWLTSQRRMFGDSVVLTEDYGSWWSYIPHFYYNFYVYKYATSFCATQIFVQRVLEGGEKRDQYLNLLRSGGSDDPLVLINKAGVDLTDRGTLEGAFGSFGESVAELGRTLDGLEG